MDVARADLPLQQPPPEGWWARATADGRLFRYATWICAALVAVMLVFTVGVLRRDAAPGDVRLAAADRAAADRQSAPGDRADGAVVAPTGDQARARAGRSGSGRLHTRLVALFSVIAAVPTVLVAIFASFLLQSGLEFWFSDRARSMLENTVELARSSYDNEVNRVASETVAMSGDLAGYAARRSRSTIRASSKRSA